MGRGQAGHRKLGRETEGASRPSSSVTCSPETLWLPGVSLALGDTETLHSHLHLAAYFCHYLMTYLHAAPCREFPPKPYTVISLHHKLRFLFAVSDRCVSAFVLPVPTSLPFPVGCLGCSEPSPSYGVTKNVWSQELTSFI